MVQRSKFSLARIAVFAVAIIALFAFFSLAAFVVAPTTFLVNQSQNFVFNFTINSTIASTAVNNITLVNITLPSGFVFKNDTNRTTVTPTNFSNTSVRTLFWAIPAGMLNDSLFYYFSFNATANETANTTINAFNITVTTVNVTGAYGVSIIPVTIADVTPPSTSFDGVTPGSWANLTNATLIINATAADNNGGTGVSTMRFMISNSSGTINQTNLTGTNNLMNYAAMTLSDGLYNVTVRADDTSGNLNATGTGNRTIRIDTVSPFAQNFSAPINGGNYSGTINLNVSATDGGSGVSTVTFNFTNSSGEATTASGSNPATNYWNVTFDTTTIADGIYNITIKVVDYAGKTNISTAGSSVSVSNVRIGNTAPVVSLSKTDSSENSLEITATIVDGTDLNSSCTVSSLDGDDSNVDVSGTSTTQIITESDLSCGENYDYVVTCRDVLGNSAGASETFATDDCDNSNSGGGGGSTTGTPTSKGNKSLSYSWTHITPGSATITKIYDADLGLKEIIIDVNNPAQNVHITVTKYADKPAAVSVSKSGKVYKYLQIDTKNLTQSLKKATIGIHVEKSWLSSNSLAKDKIALFKFDENAKKWNEVPTTYVNSDSKYEYYTADVTSFSYFSIAEKVAETTSGQTGSTTTTDSGSAAPLSGKSLGKSAWILIIIGIVIIIAVVVFWSTKGKNNTYASRVKVKHP